MTDKEIIRALELCSPQNVSIPCYDCPCWDGYEQTCKGIDYTATLDLINRQRAEIERLNEYIKRCKSGEEYWVKCLLDKPNEAYKEFAKFLIDKSSKGLLRTSDLPDYVKEMAGN